MGARQNPEIETQDFEITTFTGELLATWSDSVPFSLFAVLRGFLSPVSCFLFFPIPYCFLIPVSCFL